MGYRLRLFGGLHLQAGGGEPGDEGELAGAVAQRRPLALLAILATAGVAGVPRERLVLYLWPDSTPRRARNSLNQTLYTLRSTLGPEALVVTGVSIRLNPAVLSSDLAEFERALGEHRLEDAVALYTGPFLDGFWLAELPEFEQWVESQRARLARSHEDAVERVADEKARAGDWQRAAELRRRLVDADPYNSRYVLGLIAALDAAGDRAEALEQAERYSQRIRTELRAEPDAAILEFARRLRQGAGGLISAAAAPVPKPGSPAGPPAAPQKTTGPAWWGRTRRWRPAALVVGLAAIGAVAVATGPWRSGEGGLEAAEPAAVAVFPFRVSGGRESAYLETGVVTLLATALDGTGDLRAADPRALLNMVEGERDPDTSPGRAAAVARALRAQLYVTGEIVQSGANLRIRAALYRTGDDLPVVQSTVTGDTSGVFGLVDRLAGELLADRLTGDRDRLARAAARTTASLPALKAYLGGERELRAGHYAPAVDLFGQAVALDSAFALAWYRLSVAADWAGRDSLALAAAERAARHADRLSERDQQLLAAFRAWRDGEFTLAERLYRGLLDDHPEDVEAWFQLGEVLFHGNPLRGRSATEAREAFEQVLALDSTDVETLVHLARIASVEGRRSEVDALIKRALALNPSREALELRAFRAFALSDRDGQRRATRELLRRPSRVSAVTALQVAVYLDDLDGTETFGRLLTEPGRHADIRALGHRILARTYLARGQVEKSRAELDAMAELDPVAASELRSLYQVLPFIPVSREDLLRTREEIQRWQPERESAGESHSVVHTGLHPAIRLHRLALLDLRLGEPDRALTAAGELDRVVGSQLVGSRARTLAQSVRAHAAALDDRPQDALDALDAANWQAAANSFEAEALDRFVRADLLRRAGRLDESAAWFGALGQRAGYELIYMAPAALHQAEIAEQLGRRSEAMMHYRTAVRLWSNCDPPLRAWLERVEARLRASAGSPGVTPP